MTQKGNKAIAAAVILSFMLPAAFLLKPKRAEAFITGWVSDFFAPLTSTSTATSAVNETTQTALEFKDLAKEVLRQILMNVSKKFLQDMTKGTVNWINSGFHGKPLFLENPESFFRDIGKAEIKNLVNTYGYDSLRNPFGRDWALGIINAYRNQAQTNADYTLSRVINDPALLRSYRNDFNVGGWNGFLTNTQYPENNYLGFQITATERLARKIDGTAQTNVQKVNAALAQGMGFLSPKTCPSNPSYNNLKNEFQRPSYDPTDRVPWNPPNEENFDTTTEEGQREYEYQLARYEAQWEEFVAADRRAWERTNDCPRGLVATTPGSVVANQINQAMGSQFRQSELAAAMGNSISAVLDALVNHFLDKGLNALASNTNRPPEDEDDWSYLGNTLGSPRETGTNSTWDSGPDEELVLQALKDEVQKRIDATRAELRIMDNPDEQNPGLIQVFTEIWKETRELDMCIPGPDLHWEERLQDEKEKNDKEINEASEKGDEEDKTAERAHVAMRELQFAVNFFKDWVQNKMMKELPSGIIYMDAVNELETLAQQAAELTGTKRTRAQALARLEAIQVALSGFTQQPEPGSPEEDSLIKLRKQYDTVRQSASNSAFIDERANDLAIAKDKFFRLQSLTPRCENERVAAGWQRQGGSSSRKTAGDNNFTEEELFCSIPTLAGYEHEMFEEPNYPSGSEGNTLRQKVTQARNIFGSDYQYLPLLSASNILTWDKWGWGTGDDTLGTEVNCSLVFYASVLEYKGELPGATSVQEVKPAWTTPPGGENPNPGGNDDGGGNTGSALSCSPQTQTAQVGEIVHFAATGGNGAYSWAQNDADPSSGTGSSWGTRWSTPSDQGGKIVILTSGNESAQCQVIVN